MPQWYDALDGGFFTVTCNTTGDSGRGVRGVFSARSAFTLPTRRLQTRLSA